MLRERSLRGEATHRKSVTSELDGGLMQTETINPSDIAAEGWGYYDKLEDKRRHVKKPEKTRPIRNYHRNIYCSLPTLIIITTSFTSYVLSVYAKQRSSFQVVKSRWWFSLLAIQESKAELPPLPTTHAAAGQRWSQISELSSSLC